MAPQAELFPMTPSARSAENIFLFTSEKLSMARRPHTRSAFRVGQRRREIHAFFVDRFPNDHALEIGVLAAKLLQRSDIALLGNPAASDHVAGHRPEHRGLRGEIW